MTQGGTMPLRLVASMLALGLVAGAVAAKAGLFRVLLAGLLAAKKVVIVGLLALAGLWKKFFAKRGQSQSPQTPA